MATLLSCQDSLLYSEYKEIPNARWDSRDTLTFTLPEPEHPIDATLTVSLRSRQDYKYQYVALTVEHLIDSCTISTDTLHITLYDSNGQPLGHGFPISDNHSRPLPIHLGKDEHHTMRITHSMRLNPLEGIPDVAVSVERK